MVKMVDMVLCSALFLFFGAGLILCENSANLPESDRCTSTANCNILGTAALRKGDIQYAIHFFEEQVRYADDDAQKKELLQAYNNLAIAYVHKGDYPFAKLWLQRAQLLDAKDRSTLFNLNKVRKELQTFKWPESLTGTYYQYAGRGFWNVFCFKELPGTNASFFFYGAYYTSRWRDIGPAAEGEIQGKVTVRHGGALFEGTGDMTGCRVKMKFDQDKVSVDQEGDCSLPSRVSIKGDFYRTLTNSTACRLPDDADLK